MSACGRGSRKLVVKPGTTQQDTIWLIDQTELGIAMIVDNSDHLVGTATDGDIRCSILSGVSLDASVEEVVNEGPVTASPAQSDDEKHSAFTDLLQGRYRGRESFFLPVVDDKDRLIDVQRLTAEGTRLNKKTTRQPLQSVLVIGGAGYIGSVLSRKLLEHGYEVTVLDNLTYGDQGIAEIESERFTLVEGDMRSTEILTDAIRGMDAVIHLGAIVGEPASNLDPQKTLEMNYHATRLAADICKSHQVNRFLFASTCSVYGRAVDDRERLTEESGVNPVSLYAETKVRSEQALLKMATEHFSPTVFRMATIFGHSPRMRFDLVVNILTAKAATEGTIPIFGGKQYRPFVHVADAAQAYIDCLQAPIEDVSGQVFNVGSDEENYRIIEIGDLVSEAFPNAVVDHRPEDTDQRSYCVDFSKIREVLGYETEYTVVGGVDEMAEALNGGLYGDYTDTVYHNSRSLERQLQATEASD
ncbi:NAD-dependent epimerase/dehydratase family protein [Halobium salinum]|uniref:NAD-dependent epimerase/dehydratase family protein n=1 Tax=Halobium salinum TaxID=1364940 RepID=A0ABD5PB56_9EURY|nr:NAD-dependent epimerase/dehydratase family protein [Halobium salinum]